MKLSGQSGKFRRSLLFTSLAGIGLGYIFVPDLFSWLAILMTQEETVAAVPLPHGATIVLSQTQLPRGLSLSPDGQMLAIDMGETVVLEISSGRRLFQVSSPQSIQPEFSPSGRFLAVVEKSGVALYESAEWNPDKRKTIRFVDPEASGASITFSQDERWLAVAHSTYVGEGVGESWVSIYDVSSGTELSEFARQKYDVFEEKKDFRITSLAFVSGSNLMALSYDTTVELWNPNSSEPIYQFKLRPAIEALALKPLVTGLAPSPNGTLLASSHLNNMITVWDLPQKSERATLQLSEQLGSIINEPKVVFTKDGRHVIGIVGNHLGVWKLPDLNRLALFEKPNVGFETVAGSRNGERLAIKGIQKLQGRTSRTVIIVLDTKELLA